MYTRIPSRRTSSQTKRILQVQLWRKALVALHKKTPVQQIAVPLLEIAYTVLTPKKLSTFKKRFFNDTISKPKGWDTLLSMVWKDFERSIKKTSDSKFIQKGKITQQTSQTSSRKTAKNQADTLKTNDGQPPSSLEDKASKERLYQTIDDSHRTRDSATKGTSTNLTLKSAETQQTSQTSSRKTAKNQTDTLKTNDGQSPSSLEDKASKERLHLNINDSQPTKDNRTKGTSTSLTLKSAETQQTSQTSSKKTAKNQADTMVKKRTMVNHQAQIKVC